MAYPFWWLYSLSLGTFFVLLPLTRYMHIPSELFLIFMRNSGIRTGDKAGSFSEVQTFSCSSCGMSIDACQLNLSLGITNIQSAYLLKGIRNDMDVSSIANNCLLCGRCDVKCPVGIELSPIRMIQRRTAESENRYGNTHRGYFRKRFAAAEKQVLPAAYGFLPEVRAEKTDIVFYAGCMTHLSPAIKNSMVRILDASGLKYEFIDKDGGVCCGRPLMLAGRDREARELINHNSELIRKTGAHTLVTSCPICFKVFRESYYLDIEILHHTQYIRMLIDEGYVKMNFSRQRIAWHSPCELGRGSGVYDEPKDILRHVAILEKTAFEDENSLCCGGSLANMKINSEQKNIIARMAAAELTRSNPDILATACPLCKKTLSAATQTRVRDIAEIVADTIAESPAAKVPRRRSISIRQMARY
jgi:Fe-S oxidoreductase